LDEDNELYFSCCDSDAKNVDGTAIQASTILKRMQRVGCRERAVILDCCFSGAIGTMFGKADLRQQSQVALNSIATASGTSILTSSTDIQTSLDGAISPFTRTIVDSIQSGDADFDRDGKITLRDLFDYTSTRSNVMGLRKPMYFDIGVTGQIYISYSGKTKLSQTRDALRRKLASYYADDRISPSLNQFAMRRFDAKNDLTDQTVRSLDVLYDDILHDKINAQTFVETLVAIKIGNSEVPHPAPSSSASHSSSSSPASISILSSKVESKLTSDSPTPPSTSKSPRLISAALSIIYFANYCLCALSAVVDSGGPRKGALIIVNYSLIIYPALIILNLVSNGGSLRFVGTGNERRFRLNIKVLLGIMLEPVQSTLRQISFITKRSPWILFWMLLVILDGFHSFG
jgi:hypothetical protein